MTHYTTENTNGWTQAELDTMNRWLAEAIEERGITEEDNSDEYKRISESILRDACTCKYFTVVIPWSANGTEWHPLDKDRGTGFDPLTRGAFRTCKLAHTWAIEHLDGQPYTVKLVTLFDGE